MAVENLSEEIEKAQLERRKRYPLLNIVDDLEQIRNISEKTIEYTGEMYPSLKNAITIWELVPRFLDVFIRQFYVLAAEKRSKEQIVMIPVGEFLEIGIEYGETAGADKEGTFNPIIKVGPELKYDNDNPKNNELKKEPPLITDENREIINKVCRSAKSMLHTMYGIVVEDPDNIWQISFNFMRQIKQWLIENKDLDNYVDIRLGSCLDIGISKNDTHDLSFYDLSAGTKIEFRAPETYEEVEYCIQFGPGQSFKLDYAKGDDKTEDVKE